MAVEPSPLFGFESGFAVELGFGTLRLGTLNLGRRGNLSFGKFGFGTLGAFGFAGCLSLSVGTFIEIASGSAPIMTAISLRRNAS